MTTSTQLSLLESRKANPEASSSVDHGEVFTRRWIADLILDLVDYTPARDLADLVVVEPACGTGAFLSPILDRLLRSCETFGRDPTTLEDAIHAFDLRKANVERARRGMVKQLRKAGLSRADATGLALSWVRVGDFLRMPSERPTADLVVGNPPYVRLEAVERDTMRGYREAFPTMRGRADLYVGFIERGLQLLSTGGMLGYICADRWMHNQYGAELRRLVTESYAVDAVVAMHETDAFEDPVSAYPAIVVLRNGRQERAVVAKAGAAFDERDARTLVSFVQRPTRSTLSTESLEVTRVDRWFTGRSLWPSGSPAKLSLVAEIEARFPPLSDNVTGTHVGIGVATGCDEVYITSDPNLVEPDRLLPLLRSTDIAEGRPAWSGSYLVDPWNETGLVDLGSYPRLQRYLEEHEARLRSRHIAKKRPASWYRTIDRVDHSLLTRPKLLLPDLKAASHPVLDEGRCYPHHNLYFVVSDVWDLEVLGGLLLSDVANLFVGAYCVKMRGGCYRFQAQYLRRIRVPPIATLTKPKARRLASAFRARDREAATATATGLYGIDPTALSNALR